MRGAKPVGDNRGQIALFWLVLMVLVFLGVLSMGTLLLDRDTLPPIRGEPKKDPATGLYNVNVVVTGHRDRTFFHGNLHANIHIDFVSCYFVDLGDLPSGWSWLDFRKAIHVTVTVKSSSLASTLINTFDVTVSVGARWAQLLMYTLPPGTYVIEAHGIDQDAFASDARAELILL